MSINTFKAYTPEELRDALMSERDIDADVAADACVALCEIVARQARQIELLQEQVSQQQVFVSRLRYLAGETEVDELEEMALAAAGAGR